MQQCCWVLLSVLTEPGLTAGVAAVASRGRPLQAVQVPADLQPCSQQLHARLSSSGEY